MRIVALRVKGFRSLRDVSLEDLGSCVVFYGANGSGKSNLLDAMAVASRLMGLPTIGTAPTPLPAGCLTADDWESGGTGRIQIAITLSTEEGDVDGPRASRLTCRLVAERAASVVQASVSSVHDAAGNRLQRPSISDRRTLVEQGNDGRGTQDLARQLLPSIGQRLYAKVSADRAPRAEPASDDKAPKAIPDLLATGRIKEALFRAHTSPEDLIRHRYKLVKKLLGGEPLHRPDFDPVHDGDGYHIRELIPGDPKGRAIPLDLAGLGVSQIYAILAGALLPGTAVIGIEEPEAHLHAPTSGRHLRVLLSRLVEEKRLDQLFVATHSNLFDLDPRGFHEVVLVDGRTEVRYRPLDQLDHHLYEPGPAKRAIQRMLTYLGDDEIVFTRPDGTPVSAREMLWLLQVDDVVAVAFLDDLHGAALRTVRVRTSSRPRPA